MTDELIVKQGVTGWTSIVTGLALTANTFAQVSSSSFETIFAAVEEDYPEFEVRVQVTTGTPTENAIMAFHLRMSDGTNQEPAPSGDFAPHFRGSVTLDNTAAAYYFSDPMSSRNNKATLYVKSDDALTVSISIRAITLAPAA